MSPQPAALDIDRATVRDPRWTKIVARDPAEDGKFWYAVTTTGVYCRPSCPSRQAKPDHVRLFATCSEAESAGFRPCRRCNPRGLSTEAINLALVVKACRVLDASETSLSALAASVDLSPFYFQRLFKRATGLTPKAYAAARRAERARAALHTSPTVTAAAYDAGFTSPSRFYAALDGGMAPATRRAGGAGETLRFAVGECSLGAVLVASSAHGIVAILLGDDPDQLSRELQDRFRKATFVAGDGDYEALVSWVIAIVDGSRTTVDLPVDVRGTVFQRRVWQALRDIPAGTTASYGDIAERLGSPKATRAIAAACAANPLAVIIPCHRVVRRDGSLSGYRWGVARKHALLRQEAAALAQS